MPETLSNTQTQQLTTSENGRNVRPILVANSSFFVESSGANSFGQTLVQKFGPISDTQFRTTSKITFSGSKKVFAICQGQVFIVPQEGNSTKVNLILRPYKQPIPELSIKYFIYRGLNKSDFFDDTPEGIIVTGNETTGTDFIKHVWSEFNKFYVNENSTEDPPTFLASMIGYSDGISQLDTDLIDSYFYAPAVIDETTEEELNAFEFPLVPKGMFLGNALSEVGLDILLNKGDYYIENDPNPFQLNLAFARAADFTLDTSIGDTDYKKKLIKESCIQFMDPAAFYGLHCNGNGKLAVTNADATIELTTKDTIYTHLQNFETKNSLYLYIQSSRQRSYNFYGNYVYDNTNPNNLKIGSSDTNLIETIFGTLGWPLYIVNNQEDTFVQLITDNHLGAGLYVKLGAIASEHEQNFVREGNLLKTPSVDESNPIDTKFSKSIRIKSEMIATNAISQPIQLIYEGVELRVTESLPPPDPGQPIVEPQQFVLKDIDDVFGLLNAKPFLRPKGNVIELPSVLEHELQLINFANTQRGNDIGVVKTKRIADAIAINDTENVKRITYETLLFNIKNTNSTYAKSNSSSIDKSAAGTHSFSQSQNNFYQPAEPYYFKTKIFTDNGKTITGLQLLTVDNSLATKKIIGLTNDENQQLLNLIITNNINNCKIFFKELSDVFSVSFEGINYNVSVLGIIGEGIDGELKLFFLENSLKIYTLDSFLFASKNYSKLTPKLFLKKEQLDFSVPLLDIDIN